MRIVFMGTPEFAVPTLLEIVKNGYELVAVYTRAPARGRRGLAVRKTPVHAAAESLGIPVFTPTTLRDIEVQRIFSGLAAKVAVVAAYGLLLPGPVIEAPSLGCINLHASLLPRWRGAAPVQRAMMAGDTDTGVDVMRMDAGLDTGPVAMRETIRILPEDTAGDLTARLASIAARLSVGALQLIDAGLLEFREQSAIGVSYAHKIERAEVEIDWRQDAESVRNQVHGLSPAPGASSKISIGGRQEGIRFLRVKVAAGSGPPGTLLSEDMTVACETGAVRVLQGQRSGKVVMSGRELMRGARLARGAVFEPSRAPSAAPRAQI
jgi:methionyl-tRNA formyltransferase